MASNAIRIPLNEAKSGVYAVDSETLGISMRTFAITLPSSGDLSTKISVDYSGSAPGTLISELCSDPSEKAIQHKDWSGTKGGTNQLIHLEAGTYYLSINSMCSGISARTVSITVEADFTADADINPDPVPDPDPEPSPDPDPEPNPTPDADAIDISSAIVRLDNSYFDYTGDAVTPEVTSVRMGRVTLTPEVDYKVSYSGNINAGTANCIVTGIGKYSGSVSKAFTIKPVYLTNAVIDEVPDQKWTGSAVEPNVKASLNGKQLVRGTDYALDYGYNVDPGCATVFVNGIGNYRGQCTATFQIEKDVSQERLLEEGVTDSRSSEGKGYFGEKWLIDLDRDSLINLQISNFCISPDGSSSMTYLVSLKNEDGSVSYTWSMKAGDSKKYGLLSMPAGNWVLSISSLTNAYHTVSVRYDAATMPVGSVVEREANSKLSTATPITISDGFGYRLMGSIYDPFDAYDSVKVGDLDYFTFTLQASKRLRIKMSCHASVMFGLCDSNGDFVKRGNDPRGDSIVGETPGAGGSDIVLDTGVLPAGTYYLLVTSNKPDSWGASYFGYITENLPFDDVTAGSWYYGGVKYVYEKGLITGYSGTNLFGVGDTLTRAQLATILYRNDNPGVSDSSPVSNTTGMNDVKSGEWYTAAVNWAVKEGVIKGYTDAGGNRVAFGPDDPVTFEQLITVLANHSAEEGEIPRGSDVDSALNGFKDGRTVSSWARPSMAWAVQKGLVSGYNDHDGKYLRPGESVARERVAVVLMRAFQIGVLK